MESNGVTKSLFTLAMGYMNIEHPIIIYYY